MLQLLCQVAVFFALLSKVILDHPLVNDSQTGMMSVLLIMMLAIPLGTGILYAVLDPGADVVDDPDDVPLLPGAALFRRRKKKEEKQRVSVQEDAVRVEEAAVRVEKNTNKFASRLRPGNHTRVTPTGAPAPASSYSPESSSIVS